MNKKLTLNDHLEKFDKVLNAKWKILNDIKRNIDLKVNLLKCYHRKPYESDDFVLLELFNMYLLGGYDQKYDPDRSNLMTYVTVEITEAMSSGVRTASNIDPSISGIGISSRWKCVFIKNSSADANKAFISMGERFRRSFRKFLSLFDNSLFR